MLIPHPDYFIAFELCKSQSLAQFCETLRNCSKKPVGSVQLSELCSMTEHPNGLYLFFDNNEELWYVGKATSRSFIERVPAHFDQRHDAWFNTLPKKIRDAGLVADYQKAHALGLSLRLVLIGIKSTETAVKLEKVLRSFLLPKLNAGKQTNFTGRELLSSFEA